MKKLNLGCGDQIIPGFINCDLFNPKADVKCDAKYLPFKTNSIDEIYASHLIEHFDFYEAKEVLKEWLRVLKPFGKVWIETPDLEKSCRVFLTDYSRRLRMYSHFFSTPWVDGQFHKFLYTSDQLRSHLKDCGFRNIEAFPAKRYIDVEDCSLGMSAQK